MLVSAESGGNFGDSNDLKICSTFVSWLVNQQKVTVEKRLMVRVAKSGNAR